jgi:hypothetical protein
VRTLIIIAVALAIVSSAEARSPGFRAAEPQQSKSIKTERYKGYEVPRNWLDNGYPLPEAPRSFMEDGTFPVAWQGQYCLDKTATKVAIGGVQVYRKIVGGK